MKSPCYEWNLQVSFGLTRSCVNRYINNGIEILLSLLLVHPSSRVKWPTVEKMEECSQLIYKKKPEIGDTKIFGFVDGFRLEIKNFNDSILQESFYQFHAAKACVANIVVFTPDGCCCYYCINLPGSWHDSKCSLGLYEKLKDEKKTPSPYKLVADSGFRSLGGKIIITKKIKRTEEEQAVCSIRQSIEQSINTIVSNWPRLRLVLGTNTKKNKNLIELAILLSNFKTRIEGVNQVFSYFESRIPQIIDLYNRMSDE